VSEVNKVCGWFCFFIHMFQGAEHHAGDPELSIKVTELSTKSAEPCDTARGGGGWSLFYQQPQMEVIVPMSQADREHIDLGMRTKLGKINMRSIGNHCL
jgi:hypothetical protein